MVMILQTLRDSRGGRFISLEGSHMVFSTFQFFFLSVHVYCAIGLVFVEGLC